MTTRSIRPLTRQTSPAVRERGLRQGIQILVGCVIELRAKGLRSPEMLEVSRCCYAAVKQRVNGERAERVKAMRGRSSKGRSRGS